MSEGCPGVLLSIKTQMERNLYFSKPKAIAVGVVFTLLVLCQVKSAPGKNGDYYNLHVLNLETYNHVCKKCHLKDPHTTGGWISRREPLTDICLSCHMPPKREPLISCRKAVIPETAKILKEQIPELALNIVMDRITCESCHRVHIKEGEFTLRPEYFFFIKQAENINPHKSSIFCIFCHDKEPLTMQDPLNLKFDGDRVLICIQCHNNKRARADNHPVNIVPSDGRGIKVNEEIFPLYNGKVTCLTCHSMPCLDGERNPKFFRGGPYKERIEACLMCHTKESYSSVNPHEQFDEQGKIRKDRCLYCHIINID